MSRDWKPLPIYCRKGGSVPHEKFMKLTFPHFGNTHLVLDLYLADLGIQVVTPSRNSAQTLVEGSLYAPEEMCLPFKLMIGNLMEAYRKGADTVVMPASQGPCRLGEYAELLRVILEKEGIQYRWILLDAPGSIGWEEFQRRIQEMLGAGGAGSRTILTKGVQMVRLNQRLERLERRIRSLGGHVMEPRKLPALLRQCREGLEQASGLAEGLAVVRSAEGKLRELPLAPDRKPIRILLTGELFSMIEPFASHYLEEHLLSQGISLEKQVTLGWWLRQNGGHPWMRFRAFLDPRRKSPYLNHAIGGFARETVEESWLSRNRDIDGILQVFPSGCMPEIVAKSVLGKMAKDQNLALMTLIFDEMSGEAGYQTRVEAFADLLERRRYTN